MATLAALAGQPVAHMDSATAEQAPVSSKPVPTSPPSTQSSFPDLQPTSSSSVAVAIPSELSPNTVTGQLSASMTTSSSGADGAVNPEPNNSSVEPTTVPRHTTSDQQPNHPTTINDRPPHTAADNPMSQQQQHQYAPTVPSTDTSQPDVYSTTAPLLPALLPATPPTSTPNPPTPLSSSPFPALVALLHASSASFDQLYAAIHSHDASHSHYVNLVLPLSQRDMAEKLHRIEMVSFELGMAQSSAMRTGRELDVMGRGMERVRERLMEASGNDGMDEDGEGDAVKREHVKRTREEEESNGEIETVEQKLQRLAPDTG